MKRSLSIVELSDRHIGFQEQYVCIVYLRLTLDKPCDN